MGNNSTGTTSGSGVFEAEVGKVMGRVRSSLTEMFAAFPDGIRKSRDVQKYLGVDANLSWQVFKLLATSDLLGASRFVPATVSMRRVFEAARERGMEPEQVQAAESALNEFETLIRDHAGDRASFESMVAGVTGASDSESVRTTDLQNRKMIFKGHSYYWGMEVNIRLVTMFFHPSRAYPGSYDYAQLGGLMGFRRFRPEANLLVYRYNLQKVGEAHLKVERDVFDHESMRLCGAPAVAKFCTAPLPSFHSTTEPDGETRAELISETVGQKSRVDLTFGTISRGAPISQTLEGNRRFISTRPRIWLPTRLLIVNMLVHRPTFSRDKLFPSLKVYGHAVQSRPLDLADRQGLLPFFERLSYLGPCSSSAHLPDFPRYEEMIRYACETQQWNPDDFDVYRAKIEHPMLDTTVNAILELD
jgi:hypothetical protein